MELVGHGENHRLPCRRVLYSLLVMTIVWPPRPATGLALLAAQTTVLLTLGLLLSTVISPMASGIVAVGLWVAMVLGLAALAFQRRDL